MSEALPNPDADPGKLVLGDTELQSQTLESVGNAVHYHRWLTDLAKPWLGEHPVEMGSGLGDYAQTWLDAGTPAFTACELDPERLKILRDKFAGDPRVSVEEFDVLESPPDSSYSSYLAFNVMEHITDHVGALRAAHTLLKPGGYVVVFVPAFQFAMSDFDRAIGHCRRYTKKSLGDAYREAGLDIVKLHYVNAPGLPAWFVMMRLLRTTPGDGPLLQLWDRLVIPVARFVERFVRPPFGQSVFAVGRVPLQAPEGR